LHGIVNPQEDSIVRSKNASCSYPRLAPSGLLGIRTFLQPAKTSFNPASVVAHAMFLTKTVFLFASAKTTKSYKQLYTNYFCKYHMPTHITLKAQSKGYEKLKIKYFKYKAMKYIFTGLDTLSNSIPLLWYL